MAFKTDLEKIHLDYQANSKQPVLIPDRQSLYAQSVVVIALVRWVCDTQLITFQLVGLLVKKKQKKHLFQITSFPRTLRKMRSLKSWWIILPVSVHRLCKRKHLTKLEQLTHGDENMLQ